MATALNLAKDNRLGTRGHLQWLCETALPFWQRVGMDANYSFIDRLDINGRPLLEHPRRCITQARQIFVFAIAAKNGWAEGAATIVDRAFARMVETLFEHDCAGGWAFSCDRNGQIVDGRRDLYSQAFALLACAQHAAITERSGALDLADRTIRFLDGTMASLTGGYVECVPKSTEPRRQNPHMHLFEALLALHRVDPSRGYLKQAEKIYHLLEKRFLKENGTCLVEFFDDDWRPIGRALTFEPGHHFEWVWLLKLYEGLSGHDTSVMRNNLFISGCQGFRDDGLLFAEVAADGSPVNRFTRLWPLTEAMKACLISSDRIEGTYTPEFCWTVLKEKFIDPAVAGCWHDHFSDQDGLIVDFVPASSLYHLACAFDFWQEFRR